MDEPFSALDPLIRRQLQDQFLDLSAQLNKTTLFITHDLDEAIRLGTRIAIMNDGKIVQIGTPEEIVTNPADDYVRDFVKDISKLKLVSARTILVPMDDYIPSPGEDLSQSPRTNADTDLDGLVDLSITTSHPIVITDPEGNDIGVVSKDRLLQGIQGGQ
jgi:glycine betaine/proline transport system ATP-binding protein